MERADCISGTGRAVRPWYRGSVESTYGDARELTRSLVGLGLAGVWILYEGQIYFRHCVGCYYSSSFCPSLRGLHSQLKPLSKTPMWAGARLGSAASWAWAPTPTSPGRPGKPRSTSWRGSGWGRPPAVPYCPSTHCLVHALCSEDSGGQWRNVIPRLLFPGLVPRPHDDTRRMPPWGGGRGSAKWEVVLPASSSSPWQPQLPNCWLEGFF